MLILTQPKVKFQHSFFIFLTLLKVFYEQFWPLLENDSYIAECFAILCEEHGYVFFCNALYIHSSGSFQNGAKHHVLVFYCSIHMHLFETPLNGPLFWAFNKKRHTHAPFQVRRQSFFELSEAFHESFSKNGQNRS